MQSGYSDCGGRHYSESEYGGGDYGGEKGCLFYINDEFVDSLLLCWLIFKNE